MLAVATPQDQWLEMAILGGEGKIDTIACPKV